MKALITGTSKGIGAVLAGRLTQLGYEVYGVSRSDAGDGQIKTIVCDLSQPEEVDELLEKLNDTTFDVLVNNAAEYASMQTWDEVVWRRVVETNMTTPMKLAMKLGLSKGARVVNIVSTDAYVVGYDSPVYSATKAALISLTRSLSGLLAERKIRVNAVAPGWVDTDMSKEDLNEQAHFKTTIGRNARPDEIADAVEFMISDKASFVNGEVLHVDGGYHIVDTVLKSEATLANK